MIINRRVQHQLTEKANGYGGDSPVKKKQK